MSEVAQGEGSVNQRTGWVLAGVTAAMFGFGYALVPIYNLICEAVGLNSRGIMQVNAASLPSVDTTRTVTVEFVTTVNASAPWEFHPVTTRLQLHPGELATAEFIARNTSDLPVIAQAIPNIAPMDATKHLKKTECFCFEQQVFKPGEEKRMPVRFVLDPELPKFVDTVTLSYTIFDITQTAAASAAATGTIRSN